MSYPPQGSSSAITVQDEGTQVGRRRTLNFIGAGVSAADNSTDNRVDVTISGGGGGADEKVNVFEAGTQVGTVARALDFTDANDFSISQDTVNDQFDISINRNAASGIAGLNASSRLALAQAALQNLLDGTVHQDTAAGTVVRGDMIIGNSTPAWARSAIGGARTVRLSDGTDSSWSNAFTYILDASGLGVATSGTAETSLKSVSVPANALGASGFLEIYAFSKMAGANSTKTIRVKLGATTLFTYTEGAAVTDAEQYRIHIFNRNSATSQYTWMNTMFNNANNETGTFGTPQTEGYAANVAAEDTTAALTLEITGQVANAGDSITMRGWLVRLMRL